MRGSISKKMDGTRHIDILYSTRLCEIHRIETAGEREKEICVYCNSIEVRARRLHRVVCFGIYYIRKLM